MSDSESIPTDIEELTSLVKELRGKVTHQSIFIDQLLEQIKLARYQRKQLDIIPAQVRVIRHNG